MSTRDTRGDSLIECGYRATGGDACDTPVARAQQDATACVDSGDIQGALDVWARFANGLYDRRPPWRCPCGAEVTTAKCGLCRVVEPGSDEERELRGLWMSRRMFGWMAGIPEHRDYEEWLEVLGIRLA